MSIVSIMLVAIMDGHWWSWVTTSLSLLMMIPLYPFSFGGLPPSNDQSPWLGKTDLSKFQSVTQKNQLNVSYKNQRFWGLKLDVCLFFSKVSFLSNIPKFGWSFMIWYDMIWYDSWLVFRQFHQPLNFWYGFFLSSKSSKRFHPPDTA